MAFKLTPKLFSFKLLTFCIEFGHSDYFAAKTAGVEESKIEHWRDVRKLPDDLEKTWSLFDLEIAKARRLSDEIFQNLCTSTLDEDEIPGLVDKSIETRKTLRESCIQ